MDPGNKILHQSKKGITLVDGFYLAKNPHSEFISVLSIYKGIVYVHDVTRKMNLDELVHFESLGYLEIFQSLKTNKKNNPDENV